MFARPATIRYLVRDLLHTVSTHAEQARSNTIETFALSHPVSLLRLGYLVCLEFFNNHLHISGVGFVETNSVNFVAGFIFNTGT